MDDREEPILALESEAVSVRSEGSSSVDDRLGLVAGEDEDEDDSDSDWLRAGGVARAERVGRTVSRGAEDVRRATPPSTAEAKADRRARRSRFDWMKGA